MNLAASVLHERDRAGVALVCGEARISREELAARVAHAAGGFRALGVQPGERVLLAMRDGPEQAVAWLGAVYAGAVAVAVSGRLSMADYRHILADSGARRAIVDESFAEARAAFAGVATALPDGAAVAPFEAAADSPAFCLYSSGTTGRPKAVLHAHRVGAALGEAFRVLRLSVGDFVLTTSRFYFAYGLEHGLLAPLASGVSSVLIADWPDAAGVLRALEQHRPRALFSVPTMYRRLLREPFDISSPPASVCRRSSYGNGMTPPAANC